ncbi:hypothetical protein M9H77_27465 [Catharanthus roseus]|uniref:Uncharacterized protein n=1 Tax=Catharanthus roseus TaxID=4058 RepID=A0ACC0AE19_CATRO|nr:hypothetical protein M9H77_27465 [Catharanthus roseus]
MTCCVDLGLVDINSTETFFIWTNNQTWSKIDRAMCNQAWFSEGLYANARFLPSGFISDHSSCIVYLFEEPKIHKPSFMFINIWCEHDLFMGLAKAGWFISVIGTKQYTLCYKLKKLKRSLKDLNKKHYGHISARAEVAKSDLNQKPEELHNNPHDEQLKEMVRELQHKARFLVDAERRFYAPKTKCEFLLEEKSKRNFIETLTIEDGSTTSSLEEIQEELNRFYGDLSGTKNEVQGFDAVIMNEGLKVSAMQADFLCRECTMHEIKLPYFAPLLNKVSSTLLTWAGLNLSYADRLEVISYMVQGIESFWLGVLPISAAVLDKITPICRRFLWGGNSARVAWHTMCLSKQEGGLRLRDTQRWNDALLSKAISNIHAKKDTLWCKLHKKWVYLGYSCEEGLLPLNQAAPYN